MGGLPFQLALVVPRKFAERFREHWKAWKIRGATGEERETPLPPGDRVSYQRFHSSGGTIACLRLLHFCPRKPPPEWFFLPYFFSCHGQ
ncbi:hypothetical protein MPNT_140066 [Candidatus Methylacidithermus pantelleriae]|uniref:Uncharacterized protein n=1 Tax=Candidatus Methylacidithermus pantelleriae TaxID=2744239 RepID=A0A8J2FVJ2_9BACT|nr:hypothetical protein MPNT_140066 [Candidatus Methylacidithermus pantelleriae]